MAIIIPSKNIYEISNPKIIDNAIDKISVNKTIVKPDNDYKVSVFNEDYQIEAKITEENTQTEYKDAYALNSSGGTQRNVRGACGLRCKIEYFKIPTILIPKVKNNKVINKIYSGVERKNCQSRILYSVKTSFRNKEEISISSGEKNKRICHQKPKEWLKKAL